MEEAFARRIECDPVVVKFIEQRRERVHKKRDGITIVIVGAYHGGYIGAKLNLPIIHVGTQKTAFNSIKKLKPYQLSKLPQGFFAESNAQWRNTDSAAVMGYLQLLQTASLAMQVEEKDSKVNMMVITVLILALLYVVAKKLLADVSMPSFQLK